MSDTITAGDRVRLRAEFQDFNGNPSDPDGEIRLRILDKNRVERENFELTEANRVSEGVYERWLQTETGWDSFYFEFSGKIGGTWTRLGRQFVPLSFAER